MNCSYRILKNVNIGVRVRKTADKSTVPFNNEPLTGMKIERWDNQGFRLSHPDIPTHDHTIWLDFNQLPLNQLNIEMGVIKNPLTFVERLIKGGGITSMVLIRADTFDYLELVDDKKAKDEAIKYKPSELKIGDQVISCLCREGNMMIFLGKFIPVYSKEPYRYGYGYNQVEQRKYIESTPERYYFAYLQPNGTYTIKDYPLTNKTVVELYMASDKGKSIEENRFNDLETNRQMILASWFSKTEVHSKYPDNYLLIGDETQFKAFDFINKNSYNYQMIYVGASKENIRENAIAFYATLHNAKKHLYATKEEYDIWVKATDRYR